MKLIKEYGLLFAWIVSIIATLGSLYFSEIKGFIPCEFCWYQRILMYPQSIILGIAYFKKNNEIKSYLLPLSIIGACFSTVHYLQQKVGMFGDACTSLVPCSGQYINWFGFVTIPFLALTAFLMIIFFLTSIKK